MTLPGAKTGQYIGEKIRGIGLALRIFMCPRTLASRPPA